MRLIDGDALEKFLSDAEMEAIKRKKYVLAGALNMIQGNVRNFPTIEPETNWISCKERLPEDGQLVLSTADYGGWCFVGLDKYASVDGGSWLSEVPDESGAPECTVIAWMPLPEPYQPKEDES